MGMNASMLIYAVIAVIYTHESRLPGSGIFTLLIVYAVFTGLLAFFLHIWREDSINISDERIPNNSPGEELFKDDYRNI